MYTDVDHIPIHGDSRMICSVVYQGGVKLGEFLTVLPLGGPLSSVCWFRSLFQSRSSAGYSAIDSLSSQTNTHTHIHTLIYIYTHIYIYIYL